MTADRELVWGKRLTFWDGVEKETTAPISSNQFSEEDMELSHQNSKQKQQQSEQHQHHQHQRRYHEQQQQQEPVLHEESFDPMPTSPPSVSFAHTFYDRLPSTKWSHISVQCPTMEAKKPSSSLRVSQDGKFKDQFYRTKKKSPLSNFLHQRTNQAVGGCDNSDCFSDEDVLFSGYLQKQGAWRRNWKQRFFILRIDVPSLLYFKSEDDLKSLGQVLLSIRSTVTDRCIKNRPPFLFEVGTGSKILLLRADSRDEQIYWMRRVRDVVEGMHQSNSKTTASTRRSFNSKTSNDIFTPNREAQTIDRDEKLLMCKEGYFSDELDDVIDETIGDSSDGGFAEPDAMNSSNILKGSDFITAENVYDLAIDLEFPDAYDSPSSITSSPTVHGDCVYFVVVDACLAEGLEMGEWIGIGRTEYLRLNLDTLSSSSAAQSMRASFGVFLAFNCVKHRDLRFSVYHAYSTNTETVVGESMIGMAYCTVSDLEHLSFEDRYCAKMELSHRRRQSTTARRLFMQKPDLVGLRVNPRATSCAHHLSYQRNLGHVNALCKYSLETPNGSCILDEELILPLSTFQIPILFLKHIIDRRRHNLQNVQEVFAYELGQTVADTKKIQRRDSKLRQRRASILNDVKQYESCIDEYSRCLKYYEEILANGLLDSSNRLLFKKSIWKSDHQWRFIPTNLQIQIIHAHSNDARAPTLHSPNVPFLAKNRSTLLAMDNVWSTLTFGCAAAHSDGFQHGGAVRLHKGLQEEKNGCSEFEYHKRLDSIQCQILTIALTSIQSTLELAHSGSSEHKQIMEDMGRLGVLLSFESLLSTQGKENGMLEDMCVAVEWLNTIQLQFHPKPVDVDAQPIVLETLKSQHLLVHLYVPLDYFQELPLPLQNEDHLVCIYSVLFTQGINERQSLSNALRNSTFQHEINEQFLKVLKLYYTKYVNYHHTSSTPPMPGGESSLPKNQWASRGAKHLEELQDMFLAIEKIIHNSKNITRYKKNINLLVLTSDFCRKLGASRMTCCKSGKDRTAMSVTLEQARILATQLKVLRARELCTSMRLCGARRTNVFMNTNSDTFAFNKVQHKMLPDCYKPPMGTYRWGKA